MSRETTVLFIQEEHGWCGITCLCWLCQQSDRCSWSVGRKEAPFLQYAARLPYNLGDYSELSKQSSWPWRWFMPRLSSFLVSLHSRVGLQPFFDQRIRHCKTWHSIHNLVWEHCIRRRYLGHKTNRKFDAVLPGFVEMRTAKRLSVHPLKE